jgi:DNA-binding NtrC family response regulator
VRQIKTALQYGLTLADGGEIRPEHLPTLFSTFASSMRSPEPPRQIAAPASAAAPEPPAPQTLAAIELELVRRTVAEADGNLALAARRLGIARSTLYRSLRRAEEASP